MNSVLTYKNYHGSIGYSAEDDCLYGKILGINDLIIYEGKTLNEIKAAFEWSVDDYLETCAEIGKEPQLHRKAVMEAAKAT